MTPKNMTLPQLKAQFRKKQKAVLQQATEAFSEGFGALQAWAAGQILIGNADGVILFTSASGKEYVGVATGNVEFRTRECEIYTADGRANYAGWMLSDRIVKQVIGSDRPAGVSLK